MEHTLKEKDEEKKKHQTLMLSWLNVTLNKLDVCDFWVSSRNNKVQDEKRRFKFELNFKIK